MNLAAFVYNLLFDNYGKYIFNPTIASLYYETYLYLNFDLTKLIDPPKLVYSALKEQVTKAVFADIWQKRLTPERLAAWLLDLARAGQRRRSLSGGIGHLAGTETTESDARVK